MTTRFEIRHARPDDAAVIADLNCRLADETESKSLDRPTVQAGVVRGLQLAGDVQYLLAEQDGCIIGQLMLTREWSDWRNGWIIWLQSVYVLPDSRRQGVFRSLLSRAITLSRARPDVVGLRLYVEDNNAAARRTYEQLGFSDEHYRVMAMPFGESRV